MTATEKFIERVTEAAEDLGMTVRAVCKEAGIKSLSQVAAAKSRGSSMNWNHVSAITAVICRDGTISRDWLLFGEPPKLSRGKIRIGPGSEDVLPDVKSAPLKDGGKQPLRPISDRPPVAGKNRRRAQRTGS